MTRLVWAGVGVAALLVLDRIANVIVRPRPGAPDRTIDELEGVACRDLRIPSGDQDLAAWELRPPGEIRRPVFLIAHGWGAGYGTVLRLGEPLAKAGYQVVLFDVRGHGRNEKLPYVTIRDFRDDIAAAVRWTRARFADRPLVLVGHSFGGAGAVLAVADGAKPDALALIAAPADVMRVTAEYMSDHGLPGTFLVNAFRPFFWRKLGSTFRDFTPSRRIGEIGIPLLIVQPEHDTRVVRDHARRLAEAAGRPFALVEGAGHIDVLERRETLALIEELAEGLE